MKKIITLSVLLCLLMGCSKLTVDNSVVTDFDFNRFLGDWYEIARFDHYFERGMDQTKLLKNSDSQPDFFTKFRLQALHILPT